MSEDVYTCKCDEETEEHTCPFAVEIRDDYENLCTCCKECESDCAMDI